MAIRNDTPNNMASILPKSHPGINSQKMMKTTQSAARETCIFCFVFIYFYSIVICAAKINKKSQMANE